MLHTAPTNNKKPCDRCSLEGHKRHPCIPSRGLGYSALFGSLTVAQLFLYRVQPMGQQVKGSEGKYRGLQPRNAAECATGSPHPFHQQLNFTKLDILKVSLASHTKKVLLTILSLSP